MNALFLVTILFTCLLIGMPIAVALGFSSILTLLIFADQSFSMIGGVKYLKTGPGKVVDELNLYLVLSQDISKQPLQKVFTYQVADGTGIKPQVFNVIGSEIVEINGEKLQTIKIDCLELRLTLNLSEKYDYLPVLIKKTNGNSRFYLTLTDYQELP